VEVKEEQVELQVEEQQEPGFFMTETAGEITPIH